MAGGKHAKHQHRKARSESSVKAAWRNRNRHGGGSKQRHVIISMAAWRNRHARVNDGGSIMARGGQLSYQNAYRKAAAAASARGVSVIVAWRRNQA